MKESFNGDYYKDLLIYLKDFIIYLDLWVLNYYFNSQNSGQRIVFQSQHLPSFF